MRSNARYVGRRTAAGIARVVVMVPADRIPELKAVALAWREEAKLLLDSDLPSADQILQVHSVSRVLGIRLPIKAFATRASAAEWLATHERKMGLLRARPLRVRPQP